MRLPTRTLLSACLAVLPGVAAGQPDIVTGVARIVAVGDVHGDYAQFLAVLRQAGIVDARGRWIGGRSHLVQTGDILDRGAESRKVMELLMSLAPQAEKAGGRVHALTGNHEAMNVLGDLRYVSAGEYQAFRSGNAARLRDRAFAVFGDSARRKDPDYRRQWDEEHPLGWVEHRLAFEGNGRYGTWIRRNAAVVRIDDYVFVHGGIGPKYAAVSIGAINAGVRAALAVDARPSRDNVAEDDEGPLWYRGLATGDEAPLAAHVDSVLSRLGARHIVIGHTVTAGTVMPRHDGKVIMIDVGLSSGYGGPPACLVIEAGRPYALHRGVKLELPLGGDLLPYLRAAAALDPQPSRLQPLIEQLAAVRPGGGR